MAVFRRLFIAAAVSGLLSGAFVALVHHFATVPVILAAEVYEDAENQTAAPADAATGADAAGADHQHDDHAGWQPENGFQRTLSTTLADLLTGIGYALLLVAAYAGLGRPVTWRSGLNFGLAGFAVFVLAPGLGLPPEVPGTAAADLAARQTWWIATVALTAGGLGLLFLVQPVRPLAALLAVVMIAAPHAIGAPQPAEYHSAAPEALAHRFVAMSMLSGLLFWTVLGTLSGQVYGRLVRAEASA
jgi:cobalt transporter subunit CbtA